MTDAELTEARLSAWRDAERENTELHAKIARLRAENKRLRGERAAVVAWLLDAAQDCRLCGQQRESAALLDAADCIERGDHRREEEP